MKKAIFAGLLIFILCAPAVAQQTSGSCVGSWKEVAPKLAENHIIVVETTSDQRNNIEANAISRGLIHLNQNSHLTHVYATSLPSVDGTPPPVTVFYFVSGEDCGIGVIAVPREQLTDFLNPPSKVPDAPNDSDDDDSDDDSD